MGDKLTKSASRSDTAQKHIANNAVPMLSIVFVDQVHYNLYHDILSAIMSVRATRVLSAMRLVPSSR